LAPGSKFTEKTAGRIIVALRDRFAGEVVLPEEMETKRVAKPARPDETPRQLIGQPASPGLEAGKVRCIRSSEDLGRFQSGEVLVCDAIQPMMTHLVPLASAIVERRGGMLIHGAIIARELGIPCVNGIAGVTDLLKDGDLVTVDGYLGIVTVGPPDFDLELAAET
jgi:pyruvate,water dikinase